MFEAVEKKQILVIGDSHAMVFNHREFLRKFPKCKFFVVAVGGATASGLDNPNSVTQAYRIFRESLAKSDAGVVIVLLGEVDAGFVIWYRAKKYEHSVDEMIDRTIATYALFLGEISSERKVICISAPLPTIQDDVTWGEVNNARKEVDVTLVERTNLTIRFNTAMEKFCLSKDIKYVSLDKQSLGEDGVVNKSLLNNDPSDHHYNADVYAAMLTYELSNCLEFQD